MGRIGGALCECGCGEPAPLAIKTDRRRGWVKGEPLRFVYGHNARMYQRHDECSVAECSRVPKARGWCSVHYDRWRTTGSLESSVVRRDGLNPQGYRRVHAPDHPIAPDHGSAMEHRVVLYDSIGGGWHECHWCGTDVEWRVNDPSADSLNVDHLNHVRADNRPANLVPSCRSCNTSRNPRKTVCANGHPYSEDNTVWVRSTDGDFRACRICQQAAVQRFRSFRNCADCQQWRRQHARGRCSWCYKKLRRAERSGRIGEQTSPPREVPEREPRRTPEREPVPA